MAGLLHELTSLCTDLLSEKVTTRNKAAERLDSCLTTSKSEIIKLFSGRNTDHNISCTEMFNTVIGATLKHATKLEESQDTKSFQTLRNKIYIYPAIVNKLLEYNLEDDNKLLSKSTIFTAFIDGVTIRSAVKHFHALFLNLLERGIYKSPSYVRDLKVNEFSRILSYLFDINMENDVVLRFAILRSIIKTIELAAKYVQLSADLIDYLPEVSVFAGKAIDDRHRADVIHLFFLFVSQLSVDYHQTICTELQVLLPVMCGIFSLHMKSETKETLFTSIYLSLHAIYPLVNKCNFNTFNVSLKENWKKTLKNLHSLVDMEIRHRKTTFYRSDQANEKCFKEFVKMSALITYLIHWHVESIVHSEDALLDSRRKIAKPVDKLETLLNLIQIEKAPFNDVWLSILTELLSNYDNIINITNFQQFLNTIFHILQVFSNAKNFRNIRLCINIILRLEEELISTKSIPADYCQEVWTNLVDLLISESSSVTETIAEKQLLLQSLIAHKKLTYANCSTLLQSFMTQTTLRRTECVTTIHQMLLYADLCGIDKTSEVIARIISWIYKKDERIDAKTILLNITPIDSSLIADTTGIAVINFLAETNISRSKLKTSDTDTCDLDLIMYKYNKKLICLEGHGKEIQRLKCDQSTRRCTNEKKNCLFQSNYEHLMRVLNFETTKKTASRDILLDLDSLQKMVCLMNTFLQYEVYTEDNYTQCPLVKRIGLFLSHLEMQLKNNSPRSIERCDLFEILQHLEIVFTVLTSNKVLLQYLEKQPLEELIGFLGISLKFSVNQQLCTEFDDWMSVTYICLRILTTLCASTSHFEDTFAHVSKYKFNMNSDLNIFFTLIKIFCTQKSVNSDMADWCVDILKIIFKLYHTHVEIVDQIVQLLPIIFSYVQQFDNALENMLIALISLLKIAYKKSFPTDLTVKIISSIRVIALKCKGICGLENFTNICLSVTIFLPCPSLEIQFATINTITSLMDVDWLNDSMTTETHFDFCGKLFNHIDWKSLPTATIDMQQNSNTVTIQVLASLFAFSSYYQEIALEELAYFCALRKLTEADLYAFQQIASYYKCSLSELTKPYIANVIHSWAAKMCPILKFPYFLCCDTKDEFVQQNLSQIATCLLLYSKADELIKLNKYASKNELLKLALPIANAYKLPYLAKCEQAESFEYERNITKLNENLKVFGADVMNGNNSINWTTIYYTIIMLRDDDSRFQNMFGFSLYYNQGKWFNINCSTLERSLNFLINGNNDKESISKLFTTMIVKNSLNLVYVFGALKESIFACIFPSERQKYFYMYSKISDLIVDSIPTKKSTPRATQNCSKFFVRDIIFFVLHYIQSATHLETQRTSLLFLQHILKKPVVSEGFCSSVIKSHLNDISKVVVATIENAKFAEIERISFDLLHNVIIDNAEHLNESISLLDEFPMTENFSKLREFHFSLQPSDGEKDIRTVMRSFLHMENRGIEGLKSTRQYISKNKSQLQQESKFLYELIKRLLEFVRNARNVEFSLEAAKCLGEIGSLKIEDTTYFFQTDALFYENEIVSLEPVEYFIRCVFVSLDKLLLVYNVKTYRSVCEVAQFLVNSKQAEKVIVEETFSYFNVFQSTFETSNFLDTNISISRIDWISALKSTEAFDYNKWICNFMSQIFISCGWEAFQELAARDSYFADVALEPFIKLLMTQKQHHLSNLIVMLEYFFDEFNKAVDGGNEAADCKVIYKEKRAISKFLNICESIRIQNEWKLGVNLLHVAKACNHCQAYFLAVMYLELWALSESNESVEKSNCEIMGNDSFQQLATKAYQSIGCNDAISGFLNPLNSRLDFLNLENNWSDILLEAGATELVSEQLYTSILKRNGMLSLVGLDQNKPIDYEVCWRLCKWDILVEGHSKVNTLNGMENEFEKHHYNALKCLFNREENNSLAAIANARYCVLSILTEISVECLQGLYKYITWLQLLQQAEDFCQVQFPTTASVNEILKKWEIETHMEYGSFHCKEQILSHQVALFNIAGVRANRKVKEFYKINPIESCLLKCIKECRNAGELNLAKRNITSLKNMNLSSEQMRASVLLEDAEVCFSTGKSQITKAILQHVLKNKEFTFCLQRVRAFLMYGKYLMESNTENFETVLRNKFNGSMELLNQFAKSKDQLLQKCPNIFDLETFEDFERNNKRNIFETIAKYADREYTQLNTYVNSDEYQMKCKIIQQNRQAAESVGKLNKDRDKNIGANVLKKFANLDEKEVLSIEKKRSDNLCIAIENYIHFCKLDESISSPAIYRVIALWFANKHNEELRVKIEEGIGTVPSYKFMCALNQMTARLNSKNEAFINVLKGVLVRCVQDHPCQTLYQLFSLVFAFNDKTINKGNDRVNIAKEIIAKGKNKANANCIKQMETMFPALIEFANKEVGDTKITSISLSEKLKRLKNLDAVQCPTINLPISTNMEYNIISILKWEDAVSLVGGINVPKKLVCICSDGKKRPQLLKGKDDLRQDAVMQQVFSMINDLLQGEPETIERKLMLRTYRVVPLSMRSGILEWCENTSAVGAYLISAHKKYRPGDYSISKCRQVSMQHLKSGLEKRLQVYNHICANLKPVFHYFLLEKFLVPGIWFERRLAYTNSVATTSMVGFILGLGDRHTQNILIDEKTAEVIHIDFGIAFEQGKIMPTPETVPFRLTRDIISPMGVCEENGVFKKACEATMRILRRNHSVITTILEVLLYDPLYIWKVIPTESTGSATTHDEKNLTAQRAILCVQGKLEGKQFGALDTSSVDVQVQRLINDAKSSRNLCQLYPGWDPYC